MPSTPYHVTCRRLPNLLRQRFHLAELLEARVAGGCPSRLWSGVRLFREEAFRIALCLVDCHRSGHYHGLHINRLLRLHEEHNRFHHHNVSLGYIGDHRDHDHQELKILHVQHSCAECIHRFQHRHAALHSRLSGHGMGIARGSYLICTDLYDCWRGSGLHQTRNKYAVLDWYAWTAG